MSRQSLQRRTEVVGFFPTKAAITCLFSGILLKKNHGWAIHCTRYITRETISPV